MKTIDDRQSQGKISTRLRLVLHIQLRSRILLRLRQMLTAHVHKNHVPVLHIDAKRATDIVHVTSVLVVQSQVHLFPSHDRGQDMVASNNYEEGQQLLRTKGLEQNISKVNIEATQALTDALGGAAGSVESSFGVNQ